MYVSSANQSTMPQPAMLQQSHQQNSSPIYVSANQQQPSHAAVLPNSVSNNSVYASQQSQQPPQASPIPIYGQPNSSGSGSSNYGSQAPQFIAATPLPPPQMPSAGQSAGNGAPAPPPPPMMMSGPTPPTQPPAAPPIPPMMQPMMTSVGPPAPPGPPGGCGPPPPPPLPMGGIINRSEGMDMNSLAAQLQQARLKRNAAASAGGPPPPAENSGSSTSSGGSGNYGTIGRSSNGMASMMDEMAKTLARRRAIADKPKPEVIEIFD